jgi:UV DNA damage endonuclease
MKNPSRLCLGLCCIFRDEPIKFRQITAKTLKQVPRMKQIESLSEICLHNLISVKKTLEYVAQNNIGAFRILSPLFPRYTHPEVCYKLDELPGCKEILQVLSEIRALRKRHDIRLSFHPDQFNVLASPRLEVINNTIRELKYHAMLSELLDAEVINLHVGGSYGNKTDALIRLKKNVKALPKNILQRLCFENDDVSYTPSDLLPVCTELGVPMVYDIHHHRCLPDGLTEEEVTDKAIELWQKLGREPYFHISSPKNKWQKGSFRPHADYIDVKDFPLFWKDLKVTVDIEAKAKELAVLKLKKDLHIL